MGTFVVAVDIGTRRISAAVARRSPAGEVIAANVPLGRATESAPSTVFVAENDLIFGDAAERRGLSSPDRVLRGVVTRIGDEAPHLVGDRRLLPAEVFAATVAWVVGVAREREGADPAAIAVTVPASWADYRAAELDAALAREGLHGVRLVTAARAVTCEYEAVTPVPPGHGLAVYDLGARSFDAVVLRADRGAPGLRVAGTPVSVSGIGGADVDDALLARVLESAGLTADSPEFTTAPPLVAAALRREVVEAKEALSFDSETVIPVIVGAGGAVRVTRGELESIVEPLVERTMDALAEAIESARMSPADIDAILLVGGSSRIPRVAQMLSERFDRTVVVDADPKAIVALGAARATLATLDPAVGADEDAIGPLAAPIALPRRSWLRRAFPGAATGTAAVILASGIVLGSGSSLSPDAASFALSRSDGELSLRTPVALPEPAAVAATPAPVPSSPPEQPYARSTPRDRALTAPRPPSAVESGPIAGPSTATRAADTDPRGADHPTAPTPAQTTSPTDPPAADTGGTPDDPASSPDETTVPSPESPLTDSEPVPSDPIPTDPGQPDSEPQSDTQTETQPDSSTPPTPGSEPGSDGPVG